MQSVVTELVFTKRLYYLISDELEMQLTMCEMPLCMELQNKRFVGDATDHVIKFLMYGNAINDSVGQQIRSTK